MAAERKDLSADEIVMQMIELAEKKYNCSQNLSDQKRHGHQA